MPDPNIVNKPMEETVFVYPNGWVELFCGLAMICIAAVTFWAMPSARAATPEGAQPQAASCQHGIPIAGVRP